MTYCDILVIYWSRRWDDEAAMAVGDRQNIKGEREKMKSMRKLALAVSAIMLMGILCWGGPAFADAPVLITTSPLPEATRGELYSITFEATGTGNLEFSASSGLLGTGLSLNINGVLSGTPIISGVLNFNVTVVGDDGSTTESFYLTINEPPTPEPFDFVTTSPLPVGYVGAPYSCTIECSGGTPPHWVWLVDSQLPPGLELDNTTGIISGIPTTTGSYQFNLQANDYVGGMLYGSFSMEITNGVAPEITTASLPGAPLGMPYYLELEATGTLPIEFHREAPLPPGLAMTGEGVISGTPTTVGTYEFVIMASNLFGDDVKIFSITVTGTPPVIVTPSPMPTGTVGTAVTLYLESTGSLPINYAEVINPEIPVSFLPPGLTMDADGIISGTPTQEGIYHFRIKAQNPVGEDEKEFSMTILSAPAEPDPGQPDPEPEPPGEQELPKTDGSFPYLPLTGVGLMTLAAAYVLIRQRKKLGQQ